MATIRENGTIESPQPYGIEAKPDSGGGWAGSAPQDLGRLWNRAVENRWRLLGLLVFALVAGVAITLLQQELFRSTSQIEINRVDTGGSQTLTEGNSVFEERDQQYYNTQYELLETRTLAARVADDLDLARDPAFNDAYAGAESALPAERVVNILLANILIEPIPNSNLVDISYSSPDPELSATIANSWAQQFLEINYEKRFGDTMLARDQIEDQLSEMRMQLEQSESRLNAYANDNEIIVLSSGDEPGDSTRSTIVSEQLQSLNTAMAEATIRRINAQAALNSGNADRGAQRSAILTRISGAEAELANLRTTLGPAHPRVRAQEAEIQSLQESLQSDGVDAVEERRAAYEQAAMEEAELRQRYETARSQFLNQQGSGVGYGILQREVDTNRQIYDALLQRYNELALVGAGTNNMALVEEARPAVAPYHPSLPLNLFICLAVATFGGALAVYVTEMLDQTVRDPDELSRDIGLPLLGLLPRSEEEDLLTDLQDRHSTLSEAYASVRAAIQFLPQADQLKMLMLTSTRPGEGKTVSSVALAQSFAALGKKVVLVDLDLRKRGATRFLKPRLPGRQSFSEFLGGAQQAPAPVPVEGLDFDFVGTSANVTSPLMLLASPKLPAYLGQLRETYDQVIVDAPPVLGLADAVELSKKVDANIYVIEANSGTKRAIRLALSRLQAASPNIIGGILTKLDERNSAYGYGYGYGYGYSYAASEADDDK